MAAYTNEERKPGVMTCHGAIVSLVPCALYATAMSVSPTSAGTSREQQDVRHVYIRPKTPHLNGKVERSHRVDEQEFYQLLDKDGIGDDSHLFNDKLRDRPAGESRIQRRHD